MVLSVLVVSLIACTIVNANNCDNGQSYVTDFDPAKFQKTWYSLYEPIALKGISDHFTNSFADNGVLTSQAKSKGKTINFTGKYTDVEKDGSFNYISENMTVFSGKYKVSDTDYECYAFLNGCPKDGTGAYEKLTWIAFTEKNPSRECERKALKQAIKHDVSLGQFTRTVYV